MIHVNGLTGKKLVVATPMYGGMCSGFYMQGMMGLAGLCANYGIKFHTIILGDSLVTRARNRCVDIFKSLVDDDNDKLMFIDADIQFHAADVLRIMMMDKPVIGALYPLKQINWNRVANILKSQPDFPPAELPRAASDYVFNFKLPPGETKGKIDVSTPVAVRDLGTGFLMIRRHVLTDIEAAGLVKQYNPCHNEEIYSGSTVYAHFTDGIDSEMGVGDADQFLSEDWAFCRRWQKLGGEVLVCPWIKLTHFGTMGYQGDLASLALSGARIGEEYDPHGA